MKRKTKTVTAVAVVEKQAGEVAEVGGNTPADLLRLAVKTGADVDRLAKLMDLQDRWQAQQAKREFIEAMSQFQNDLPVIAKIREVRKSTTSGAGLLYKFANLDDIVKAIRPFEQKHGFIHRFDFQPREGGGCKCTCVITHRGGHSESTTVSIPTTTGINTNAAQNNGIEMAYGQRYSLIGGYGITTANEDRDGKAGGGEEYVTQAQAKTIKDMIKSSGADEPKFLEWLKASSVDTIPVAMYDEAVKMLNKKLDQVIAQKGGPK